MSAHLQALIDAVLGRTTLRANSLITTLFGDSIAPHGNSLWLGSLIALVAPLGLNERLVRTSVFRLVQEDWLVSRPIGRRSLYTLSASGLRRIQHAYRRIYAPPAESWNGQWQIAVLPEGSFPAKEKESLRRNLLWEGYGQIANGVFAHPSGDSSGLKQLLEDLQFSEKLALFKANALATTSGTALQTLVEQCWHLDDLAENYAQFVAQFSPLKTALRRIAAPDPLQSFVIRTLLIHEFRRIQLRDPQLPDALLDRDWPGKKARRLCQDIYELVLTSSEQHLMENLKTEGPTPPAAASLFTRFSAKHATC